MKKLLFLFLLVSPAIFAQNGNVVDIALGVVTQNTTLGNLTYTTPIPGAVITVCSLGSMGNPCNTPIPGLCTNQTDTVCNQANPTFADIRGNYSFWVPGGKSYTVSVTSLTYTGFLLTYSVPLDPTGPVTFGSSVNVVGGLTAGSVTSANFILSGAPAGRCIQTGTGGALTALSAGCGLTTTSLTSTGSPSANEIGVWSGSTSLTGFANFAYTLAGGFLLNQSANGLPTFTIHRFTDTSPTGTVFLFQNAANSQILYSLDVFGNQVGSSYQSLSANPSSTGIFRCASTDVCVSFRNNANSGDVQLTKNSLDQPLFGGFILPTLTGGATPGDAVTIANSGQIQDSGAPVYTNGGTTTSVCTTSTVSSPCTSTITLFRTEVDTNYAITASCIGASGFPHIHGITKGLTTVSVDIAEGTASQGIPSTCTELDVVITR
jgi:hypothetical protein